MRRALWLPVFVCLVAAAADAQQPTAAPTTAAKPTPRTATERALFAAEDAWTQALVRRDAAAFRRLIAPGWVYTDERGIMGKEQAIAEFTTGSDTVEEAGNEEMQAHVYGNMAVVTGILFTRGRGKDGPFSHRYRYTDTWLKRGGRWQCVASQDYDMPQG